MFLKNSYVATITKDSIELVPNILTLTEQNTRNGLNIIFFFKG